MPRDFSEKNLQKAHFTNQDLSHAMFANSDLRGADFSGADLTGADFTHVKTGIPPLYSGLIFISALILSAVSAYMATLAGRAIQSMLNSNVPAARAGGIVAAVTILLFIGYSIWKGVGTAVKQLMIPAALIITLIGATVVITGAGNGKAALYILLSYLLVLVMFFVGTMARAAAGSLSDIMFTVVAIGGALVSKSLGGGIGATIMAVSCMIISKRALKGAKGFERLRALSLFITRKLGTSFRGAKMDHTHFFLSSVRNTDFTGANVSTAEWENTKRVNCVTDEPPQTT